MSPGVDTSLGGALRSFGSAPLLEAFSESSSSATWSCSGFSDSELLEFLLFTSFLGRKAGLGRACSRL